jgi:hypothetical protein
MKQLQLVLIQPDPKKGIMTDYLEAIKAGYQVLTTNNRILYQPNLVSRTRRIISA